MCKCNVCAVCTVLYCTVLYCCILYSNILLYDRYLIVLYRLLYYFLDLTDPVNVISLYPHLLPSELRATVSQPLPAAPPVLTGEA